MIENIQWLGHGSFLIKGTPILYINPWRIVRSAFHADLILVGHDHYDHCSVADIEKLRGPETRIIGSEGVARQVRDTMVLRPWQSITVERLSIKAIPAYSPRSLQHPLEDGGLGFLISMNYYDIYYAGDTQITPELQRIRPDIAILPIDDDGTLSVEEAVEVVKMLRPRWVFPSNWGTPGEGVPLAEAQRFARLVGDRAKVILPPEAGLKESI